MDGPSLNPLFLIEKRFPGGSIIKPIDSRKTAHPVFRGNTGELISLNFEFTLKTIPIISVTNLFAMVKENIIICNLQQFDRASRNVTNNY